MRGVGVCGFHRGQILIYLDLHFLRTVSPDVTLVVLARTHDDTVGFDQCFQRDDEVTFLR